MQAIPFIWSKSSYKLSVTRLHHSGKESGLRLRLPLWCHQWCSFLVISQADDVIKCMSILPWLIANQKRESAPSMGSIYIYVCIYIYIYIYIYILTYLFGTLTHIHNVLQPKILASIRLMLTASIQNWHSFVLGHVCLVRYGDSHYKDEMVVRGLIFIMEIAKMLSLYWDATLAH